MIRYVALLFPMKHSFYRLLYVLGTVNSVNLRFCPILSSIENREVGASLWGGMKGTFIFLRHTSIQTILTDMLETIGTRGKSEGLQHGNLLV